MCLFTFLYAVFFFQAEDGIRDLIVTGVQTCALPISCRPAGRPVGASGAYSGRRADCGSAGKAKRDRYCVAESRYCAADPERRMTLIFDCDGVLVDSEVIAHQTLLDVLIPLGFTMTLQESFRVFAGRSLKDTIAV